MDSAPTTAGVDRSDRSSTSRETAFETLSNERRRYVVHRLQQGGGSVELRDLSTVVAAWENGKDPEAITATERRRVYNALQQSHLPKMDDAGLLDYNSDRGEIEAMDALSDLEVYLEVVPGNDIPWSSYYLLLGSFCTLLTVAVVWGVPPFDPLSLGPIALLTSLLFTGSAVVHVWRSRRRMRLGSEGPPPEF